MSKNLDKKSFTLFSFKGIPVKVHFSYIAFVFLVILFLIFAQSIVWALKTVQVITFLFVAVVIHELGHAYAAFRLGHKVHDITIFPVGGLATIEIKSYKNLDLALIAFAGPASNFILFLACSFFESLALDSLGILSLILGLGNLLPIRSFDGGVILKSVLIQKFNTKKTNQILLVISILIVGLIGLAGLYTQSFLLCISALFMFIYGVVLNDNTQQSNF